MDWQTDDVLEQSISSITSGKARVESCLLSYPAMADELEPLLKTAEQLRSVPKPDLAPEAKERIADRVLAAAAANPRLRPTSRRRWGLSVLSGWRWAFAALPAVLVFVFLVATLLVAISKDALPSSGLYQVKLTVEDAWMWVTPERARPALHVRFARRRLVEARVLAEQGLFDESVLQDMMAHMESALEAVEDLPPALAQPVLEQMAAQIEEQQQTLVHLLTEIPIASRPYVEEALRAGDRHRSLVAALQDRLNLTEPSPSAALVDTATPATTPALTRTLAITATLTPTFTLTPTSSLTPTFTPTPSATPTSPPTSEPAGGSMPEETQPPPPPPTATQPPPPPPTATQPPAEPTDTPRVPPGLTKTPEPPGQTRTPKP